jgi:hypothetical protein
LPALKLSGRGAEFLLLKEDLGLNFNTGIGQGCLAAKA